MLIAIDCSKCGATNKFEHDTIPSFCSFCGAPFPEMKKHVDEIVKIELMRQNNKAIVDYENDMAGVQQRYHSMEMEREDKRMRKDRRNNIAMIIALIPVTIIVLVWLIAIIKWG